MLAGTDRTRVQVTTKDGRVELSTSADRASQAAAVAVLRDAYPDHGVIGEDGDLDGTGPDHVWLVDGLDGTSNFANGLPWYWVSVALRCRESGGDEAVTGAVSDPVHGELFAAARGRGSTVNGAPLQVAGTGTLGRAIVASRVASAEVTDVVASNGAIHEELLGVLAR